MPRKFREFARESLVQPVIVNSGRAGAANLDVIQEVEYVKADSKIVYLLECLQKTGPPVVVFSARTKEGRWQLKLSVVCCRMFFLCLVFIFTPFPLLSFVFQLFPWTLAVDDIHEYLLIKGLKAVSIHGSKDQEERREGMRLFKAGEVDILVATDVAAKGLDFPDIQHVINFDMYVLFYVKINFFHYFTISPFHHGHLVSDTFSCSLPLSLCPLMLYRPEEIENYIHRIGRTGRCGKTGVATTFINGTVEESILLDLKGILLEAKQHIPPVLDRLQHPQDEMSEELRKALDADAEKDGLARGCAFCGGLEHRITNCPKLMKDQRRLNPTNSDAMRTDAGGDW